MLREFESTRLFMRLNCLLALCLACLSVPAQAAVIKGYNLNASASYEQVYSKALADIAVSFDDDGLVTSAWFAFGGQTLRANFGQGGVSYLSNLTFGTSASSIGFDPGSTSLTLAGKTGAAGEYGAVLQALVDQLINPFSMQLTDFAGCNSATTPCTYGLLGLGGLRQANDISAAAILFEPTGALVGNATFVRTQINIVRANAGYAAFSAEAIPELTPVSTVPEPDSLGMMLLGLAAVTFRQKMAKAKRTTDTV